MAQPKRRHSHARKNKRRSHHALKVDGLSVCPKCKEPKLPHRVCGNCGYYQGKQI
ncbi:MAG: 50S ribosomal protein L32, partial [Candidatus Aminicenantes bacterium]|nr:50S ribosomal protein L32 [Candidatus Aminicenantes bacterium]